MSRDERHHVNLETAADAVHSAAHRRATLEEQLLTALADGDAEAVSRLRQRIEALEASA